nr:MAG TPA: GroEL protein allosteric state, Asymmetrical, tetradecamer [Caudoviricetes sp.]
MRKKLDFKSLDVLKPNVVENDLLYITSVLGYIDNVISKTYGPYSGYVTSIKMADTEERQITYTKDGYRTLANMSFNSRIDTDILNITRALANEVKTESGDGSTTAVKVLFNTIKQASEAIINNDDNIYSKRINTPKAVDLILSKLDEVASKKAIKPTSVQDIIDCAYISVNNDMTLMEPFKEIASDLIEREVDIKDGGLEISAFRSTGKNTKVEKNPGFNLGAYRFIGRPLDYSIPVAKIILLSNNLSMDYNGFILPRLIEDAQILGEGTNINTLYICSGLDNVCKRELARTLRAYETKNKKLYCDFLEVPYIYDATNYKKEDLSYFANIDEININDFVEKRPGIVDPNVDTMDNTELVKWRLGVDKDGNIVDDLLGYKKYNKAHKEQLEKGEFVSVRYIHGVGMSISHISTGKKNTTYEAHIEKLKEIVRDSKEEDLVNVAKQRLQYMKDNYYTIYVGQRVSDNERIFDAYNDASRAVSSMIRDGYHMGGSIGAIDIIHSVKEELEKEEKTSPRDTALFLLDLLKNSFKEIIPLLFEEKISIEKAVEQGRIDFDSMMFDSTRVIVPISTDLTIIKTVLLQFSSLFSSLIIELDHPDDTFIMKTATKDILRRLENNSSNEEKEDDKKEDNGIKLEAIVPAHSLNEEIVSEEEIKELMDKKKKMEEEAKEVIEKPSKENKEESVEAEFPTKEEELKEKGKSFFDMAVSIMGEEGLKNAINAAIRSTREDMGDDPRKEKFKEIKELGEKRNNTNDVFEQTKKEIEEEIKVNEELNKMDKGISQQFEEENGVSVGEAVKKVQESIKDFYSGTKEEKIGDGSNGIKIEIEVPKAITPDDLEKIRKGELGDL